MIFPLPTKHWFSASQKICNSLSLAWHVWRSSLSYLLGRLARLGSSLYHPFHARCRCPVSVGWSHCLLFIKSCWRRALALVVNGMMYPKELYCEANTLSTLHFVRFGRVYVCVYRPNYHRHNPNSTQMHFLQGLCGVDSARAQLCLIWLRVVGDQQLTRSCLPIACFQIL